MIDFDFIPPNYHMERCVRSAVRLRAGLIGTMLMIMVLWITANRRELATANAMLSEIQKQSEQVAIHQTRQHTMEEERERLRLHHELLKHLERKTSIVVLLADLSHRMPESVVLTSIRFDSPSVAKFARELSPAASAAGVEQKPRESLEPASGAGAVDPVFRRHSRLVLTGMATDTTEVISFVKRLEDSDLVGEVQMLQKGPVTWSGWRGQGFELTCEIYDHTRVRR